jgi:hypothetical protein
MGSCGDGPKGWCLFTVSRDECRAGADSVIHEIGFELCKDQKEESVGIKVAGR